MFGARSHVLMANQFKYNVSFLTLINALFKVTCWSMPYLLCCSLIGILPSLCIFCIRVCFLQQGGWPYVLSLPISHSLANTEGRNQSENGQA